MISLKVIKFITPASVSMDTMTAAANVDFFGGQVAVNVSSAREVFTFWCYYRLTNEYCRRNHRTS